ncbi:MAG: RagB/SusD family nutrient uptake outer membrane protein [Paludibacter sp. 47-17]|nr:MAG: RagB/SusD family nutrient uptake outer membrane protein [Paludibacter sp. 47-17]
MKKLYFTLFTALLLFSTACSELNEIVLDESLTGGADSTIVESTISPAYALLPDLFLHTKYFALQEITTDEAILPYRGGKDWGDNGIYIALHQHTYTPVHSNVKQVWDNLTKMIAYSVIAINELSPLASSSEEAKVFVAEARGLKAYYNMLMLDLWGLAFKKESPDAKSEILRGEAAVAYIQSEFETALKDLRTNVGPGRLTKYGAYALLTRLHLNAAVYRDPYATNFTFKAADMDKVIEYTDLIINSGQYELAREYFSIFDNDNHTNKELIFAIDQRQELNGHNRMSYFSMSGNFYGNALVQKGNGTDGPGITPDFYDAWVEANGATDPAAADCRFWWERLIIPSDSAVTADQYEPNRGIYRGMQYGLQNTGSQTAFLKTADGRFKIGKIRDWRQAEANAVVNYTREINFTAAGSGYNTGYRVLKYQWSKSSTDGRNKGEADLVIVRLADIYLMRAEAKLRKGNTAGALADVNRVRSSRTARPTVTPQPLTALTTNILFRERGFEFYWEHQRRTDMIRFEKYEGSWTEKTNSDRTKRLFPIPQTAIDGASKTEGYLIQNTGYN